MDILRFLTSYTTTSGQVAAGTPNTRPRPVEHRSFMPWTNSLSSVLAVIRHATDTLVIETGAQLRW
jgi:hypothetical protein